MADAGAVAGSVPDILFGLWDTIKEAIITLGFFLFSVWKTIPYPLRVLTGLAIILLGIYLAFYIIENFDEWKTVRSI